MPPSKLKGPESTKYTGLANQWTLRRAGGQIFVVARLFYDLIFEKKRQREDARPRDTEHEARSTEYGVKGVHAMPIKSNLVWVWSVV